jgi:hypothetical protein
MKLSKVTKTFRPRSESLYKINKNIKDGKYKVEWLDRTKSPSPSFIARDIFGYPIKDIGAREHVDGTLTLYLPQEWVERFSFLNKKSKFNGLTLYEFEDPGFYESLTVTILVADPTSTLDPSLI